jgi:hypothetical protein
VTGAPVRAAWACLLAAGLGLAGGAPAAAQDHGNPPKEAAKEPFRWVPAARHCNLVWRADGRVKGARLVVPHPFHPTRALLATASGLLLTDDAGQEWKPLPAGAPDRLGVVAAAVFAPDDPDRFYVAPAGKGVWATADGGRTFARIGSAAAGMASDQVQGLCLYPYDPSFRTLLALHGEAAPGFSRSLDGGKSWQVLAPAYHARAVLFGPLERNRIVYLSASRKDRPEVYSLWASSILGDSWIEVASDVLAVEGVLTSPPNNQALWATQFGGLLDLSRRGASAERVGPPDVDRWAGVGVTGGAGPAAEAIFAYEPARRGVVVSEDGFRTASSQNQGLFVGPFVREGAHVRASVDGAAWYAVINQTLYAGRLAAADFQVRDAAAQPPMIDVSSTAYLGVMKEVYAAIRKFASARQAGVEAVALAAFLRERKKDFPQRPVQLTARVRGKPLRVTGDLTLLGGPKEAEFFDDGRHGDGAEGDGVYGAPAVFSLRDVRRPDAPMPLNRPASVPVTARWDGDRSDTAAAVVTFLRRAQGFVYWNEGGCQVVDAEGPVEGQVVADPKSKEGKHCIRLTAGTGKWFAPWMHRWTVWDLSGYHALSFWVRTDDGAASDLRVYLRTNFDEALPAVSPPAAVVKDRFIEGGALSAEWRRVVIPLDHFLRQKSDFEPSCFGGVAFGGDAGPARSYFIDDIRVVASPAELEEAGP